MAILANAVDVPQLTYQHFVSRNQCEMHIRAQLPAHLACDWKQLVRALYIRRHEQNISVILRRPLGLSNSMKRLGQVHKPERSIVVSILDLRRGLLFDYFDRYRGRNWRARRFWTAICIEWMPPVLGPQVGRYVVHEYVDDSRQEAGQTEPFESLSGRNSGRTPRVPSARRPSPLDVEVIILFGNPKFWVKPRPHVCALRSVTRQVSHETRLCRTAPNCLQCRGYGDV